MTKRYRLSRVGLYVLLPVAGWVVGCDGLTPPPVENDNTGGNVNTNTGENVNDNTGGNDNTGENINDNTGENLNDNAGDNVNENTDGNANENTDGNVNENTDGNANDNGTGTDPDEFVNADVARGGGLYDKWWAVAGVDAPTDDHPIWAEQDTNARAGADTWRCKECHGWDYKGIDGAYSGSSSHMTGFAGIFGTTLSAQEAFDLLSDADRHGFGGVGMTDADLWDLAKFVLEGQLDTDTMIDADGMFTDVAADGMAPYDTNCGGCHGDDGLSIPPTGDPAFDAFVGTLSNDNPWEFQHKVRFGQPGSIMGALFDTLTAEEVGALGAYAQTLP